MNNFLQIRMFKSTLVNHHQGICKPMLWFEYAMVWDRGHLGRGCHERA